LSNNICDEKFYLHSDKKSCCFYGKPAVLPEGASLLQCSKDGHPAISAGQEQLVLCIWEGTADSLRRIKRKKASETGRNGDVMLTPNDIQNHDLKTGVYGYSKKETDDFLQEILKEYEDLYKENRELEEKIDSLNEGIQYYKKMETTLQKALVLAEKTSTETQEAAKSRADSLINEAQAKADALTKEAQVKADALTKESEAKADALAKESQAKADALTKEAQAKADALTKEAQAKADALAKETWAKADSLTKETQAKAGILKSKVNRELEDARNHIRKLVQSYENYRLQFKKLAESQIEMLDSESFSIFVPELEEMLDSIPDENTLAEAGKAAVNQKPKAKPKAKIKLSAKAVSASKRAENNLPKSAFPENIPVQTAQEKGASEKRTGGNAVLEENVPEEDAFREDSQADAPAKKNRENKRTSSHGSNKKPAGKQANSADTLANTAGKQTNSAGKQANSAGKSANPAGKQANTAGKQASPAGKQVNTAGKPANSSGRGKDSRKGGHRPENHSDQPSQAAPKWEDGRFSNSDISSVEPQKDSYFTFIDID